MALYQAVKLASKQPKSVSTNNARLGPQYYMFGAPGSAACAAAAKHDGTTPTPGQHCLLAGPDTSSTRPRTSRRSRTSPRSCRRA